MSVAQPYRTILLDIDGVLRLGNQPIAGAGATVQALRRRGHALALVTNNAAATPEQMAAKLGVLGVEVAAQEIVSSPMAAAQELAPGTRCLVIGMQGLREALQERGCVEVIDPAHAQAVVVGIDRDLVWDDLHRATLAIRSGARFLATNDDATFPSPEGLGPGAGAIVAALERSTGIIAEVAGKPHAPLLELAAAAAGGGGPVLVVGDRYETDIVGAMALGWDTALVLTGVTGRNDLATLPAPPTYVLDSVNDLLRPAPR
jgi:HAD superfamily hydrolase (TIGR01450 family)